MSIPMVWGGEGSLPRIAVPIGSNGTKFQMVADTGSDSFWVLSQSAAKAPGHGLRCQDSVTFANQTFRNMSVGVVSTPGGFAQLPHFAVPYDGVFGFSPGTGRSADMNAPTPPQSDGSQQNDPRRHRLEVPHNQVTLGWANASNSQPGTQVEVANAHGAFWAVNVTSIKARNTTVGRAPITAVLDTGTVALESRALLARIPGYKHARGTTMVPCSATADVAFEIGGSADVVGAPMSNGLARCAGRRTRRCRARTGSSELHNWHVVYNQTSGNTTIAQANQ